MFKKYMTNCFLFSEILLESFMAFPRLAVLINIHELHGTPGRLPNFTGLANLTNQT